MTKSHNGKFRSYLSPRGKVYNNVVACRYLRGDADPERPADADRRRIFDGSPVSGKRRIEDQRLRFRLVELLLLTWPRISTEGLVTVSGGFLKGTITPNFHFVEFTVCNGKVVKRRIVPVGFTA